MAQSMHTLSCVALEAHQHGHDLSTAGDQADVHGFPGGFVVNLYTAPELLTEMGRRVFTLFLEGDELQDAETSHCISRASFSIISITQEKYSNKQSV